MSRYMSRYDAITVDVIIDAVFVNINDLIIIAIVPYWHTRRQYLAFITVASIIIIIIIIINVIMNVITLLSSPSSSSLFYRHHHHHHHCNHNKPSQH